MTTTHATAAARPPQGLAAWLRSERRWLAVAAVGLVFAGHTLYGAMLPQTSLLLTFGAGALLCGALADRAVRQGLARTRDLRPVTLLFGLVLAVGLLSLTPLAPGGPHPSWAYLQISPGAVTVDRSATVLELLKLLGLACVFMLGVLVGASDERARAALNMIIALGAVFGFGAFLAFAADGGEPGGLRRLGGPFLSPNTAATFFSILLMLGVAGLMNALKVAQPRERLSRSAPYAGAVLIFAICLVATASRGGFTATALGLLAMAALHLFTGRARPSRTLLVSLAALVLAAGVIAVAGNFLIDRFLGQSWELDGRRQIFATHWAAFKAAPLMGYGLGSFDTLNRMLMDAQNIRELWVVRAAHNVYLSWLEQAGLIGALPMFGCIGLILVQSVRGTLRRTRMTSLLFALLAADVVVLAHGVTDFALEMFSVAAFWSLLLGLQFSASRGSSGR